MVQYRSRYKKCQLRILTRRAEDFYPTRQDSHGFTAYSFDSNGNCFLDKQTCTAKEICYCLKFRWSRAPTLYLGNTMQCSRPSLDSGHGRNHGTWVRASGSATRSTKSRLVTVYTTSSVQHQRARTIYTKRRGEESLNGYVAVAVDGCCLSTRRSDFGHGRNRGPHHRSTRLAIIGMIET